LGPSPNVHLYNVALGSAPGEGLLHTNAAVSGLASLTRRRLDHIGVQMDRRETVRIDTLDSLRAGLGVDRIDLLKLDVEGHELDVLRGATETLRRRIIRLVQFEFGGCNLDTRTTLQDFFYFFGEVGFDLSLVQPSGKLRRLPRYGEIYEQYRTTNYVAAPR
jgi:FkbM family methyltransferase